MISNAGRDLVDTLVQLGVEYVFGQPGGQALPIYDRIYELQPKINHILVRDERCAAYMADGYARAKAVLGVCDATVGPGATNLISGVAEAYGAASPLLVLTTDVDSAAAGRGASQELDQLSTFRPLCKWSTRVDRPDRVHAVIRHAAELALSGRPGPVYLSFPPDVLRKETHGVANTGKAVFLPHRPRPDPSSIQDAIKLLMEAERPVIFAGGGVLWSQAWDELVELAELLSIPVATTITGKGAIPENHPLAVGVSGSYNRPCALRVMQEADVVLVVGTKLGEVATAGWTVPKHEAKLIHIDIDAAVIGRNYRTTVGMAADAKLAVRDLLEHIRGKSFPSHENWVRDAAGFVDKWREMAKKKMESPTDPIRPEYVIHAIREAMSPDEPLVSDASFPTVWTGAYFDVLRSGRVYTAPRGAGGTGGGFPLSLGFQTALPDKRVFCVAGDCGFSVVCQELETAARIGLPVISIVLNNSSLGYIRHEQKAFYNGRFVSTEFRRVDFAKVAEGFGCLGIRVEKAEELSGALKQAKNSNGPAVLDVNVDPWAYPPVLEFLSSGWNEELTAFMKA